MTPLAAADLPAACPSFIHRPGDLPASRPFLILGDSSGVLLARYRCPCGRVWERGFDPVAPEWPIERVEAA